MNDYEDMDDMDFEEELDLEEGEERGEDEGGLGIRMGMGIMGENDEEEEEEEGDEGGDYDYEEEDPSAPVYTVPPREIVAVEHPLIIKNLENGIKTFGRQPQWNKVCRIYLIFGVPCCFDICMTNESHLVIVS